MDIPAELRYSEHDEWVRVDGDETVTGITDYAQDQLSDIVYVELPEVGDHFEQGEPYGVVESVKAASDLNMPIAGEITAANTDLEDTPEIVNQAPYAAGWLIRIRPDRIGDVDALMDAEAYRERIEEQG
ncbi:MAG: glycine cleavage system protein GcvH [Ardenticatenales bacterium]|nr:glycine cleavage system protein GcvH [Ardenticatenales bacterium]